MAPPVAVPMPPQRSTPAIAPGAAAAQPQQMQNAQPRGQDAKAAASKPDDKKTEGGEQKHEDDNRKRRE